MTEKEVLKIFKSEKALLSGHFLLSSGLHSGQYMQCAFLLQKPWIAEKLCKALAKKISKNRVDVVIGPALGGVIVSYEMGRVLKVRSIFAERLPATRLPPACRTGRDGQGQAGVDESLTLRRGFSLKKNEKVLVAEDVVTTGKSTNEVIEIVKKSGAKLVGVAAIVDRGDGAEPFSVPFYSLLKINIKSYAAGSCPLCKEGKIPVMKPGSRTKKS